jgi:gamma-glutamyltranspeptidase
MQMNMASLFDLRALGHNRPDYIHTLVEIKKLAFAERDRYITDPAFTEIPLDRLLSTEHARRLLEAWRVDSARGTRPRGDRPPRRRTPSRRSPTPGTATPSSWPRSTPMETPSR